jgi:DNA-binding NarL/FixJ family response regulator
LTSTQKDKTSEAPVILVASHSPSMRDHLCRALKDKYRAVEVESALQGEEVLAGSGAGAVICSENLTDMDGLEWLGQLKRRNRDVLRLFAPERPSLDLAVSAINISGVFRYIPDASRQDVVLRAVDDAVSMAGHRVGPPCMREAVGRTIKAHTLCRESKKGCLVEAGRENAGVHASLSKHLKSYMGWTGMGMLSILVLLLSGLFLGIGVFTVLYIVKSILGIDLIDGWHFTDWLRN